MTQTITSVIEGFAEHVGYLEAGVPQKHCTPRAALASWVLAVARDGAFCQAILHRQLKHCLQSRQASTLACF